MNFSMLIELLDKKKMELSVNIPDRATVCNPEINMLFSDSRKVVPGSIFACVKGGHTDGHEFSDKAAELGASALICEHPLDTPLPQIITKDIRRNMGTIASVLYGEPAKKLSMIAITGTNGKTTSTFMTKSILEHAGMKTGLLGTVYYDDGDVFEDAEHTTPEASDLQYWLYRMVKNGCKACVMETSSHSIVQGRIDGVMYDRAGFTNLSVDHLDYHKDMENYFNAKKLLFEKYMRNNWKACVNTDDSYGRRLYGALCDKAMSFGINDQSADFRAVIKATSIEGMEADIKIPDSKSPYSVRLPLLGNYNIMNALQALSISWTLGISNSDAIEGLQNMKQVPGRLERYLIKDGGSCVIDFAHSPDSLEKVLGALRPVCKGKLCVVFGAGGDRDKTKRPLMGEVASRLADEVIVTSDNPRSEDPETITKEIEAGVKQHHSNYKIIIDRREAIYEGLSSVSEGDILLVSGKGPERYQILKDGSIPFLDKDVLSDWCAKNSMELA